MKIYVVYYNDFEGSFAESFHSSYEGAKKYVESRKGDWQYKDLEIVETELKS